MSVFNGHWKIQQALIRQMIPKASEEILFTKKVYLVNFVESIYVSKEFGIT